MGDGKPVKENSDSKAMTPRKTVDAVFNTVSHDPIITNTLANQVTADFKNPSISDEKTAENAIDISLLLAKTEKGINLRQFTINSKLNKMADIFKQVSGSSLKAQLAGSSSPNGSKLASNLAQETAEDLNNQNLGSWIFENKIYDRYSPMHKLIAQKIENQYTTNAFRKAMAVSLSITGDQMSSSKLLEIAGSRDMIYNNDSSKYKAAMEILNDKHADDNSVRQASDVLLDHTLKYGTKKEMISIGQILATATQYKAQALRYATGKTYSNSQFSTQILKSLTEISKTVGYQETQDRKDNRADRIQRMALWNSYAKTPEGVSLSKKNPEQFTRAMEAYLDPDQIQEIKDLNNTVKDVKEKSETEAQRKADKSQRTTNAPSMINLGMG